MKKNQRKVGIWKSSWNTSGNANSRYSTKFRYIQCISNLLSDCSSEKQTRVYLTYRIVNYSGLFVNILISNINSFKIHLSYTLRIKVDKYINYTKEKKTIPISKINLPGKYDEGCIPELDNEIKKIFCS